MITASMPMGRLSGKARGVPFASEVKHLAVLAGRCCRAGRKRRRAVLDDAMNLAKASFGERRDVRAREAVSQLRPQGR